MKNNEKNKPTKKKIITYYLVLAACLLVIAGITVGVVFAVRGNNVDNGPVIDNPDDNNPNNPDKPDKPDDGAHVDTSTKYEFIVPVKTVNLTQAHVFAHDKTLDRYCLHEGMDFGCEAGSEVLAAVDGKIKSVVTDDRLYGGVVTIEHANGIVTVYKYVEPAENLKEGTEISRGDVIGKVLKATGAENASGDHLHFEVYENNIMQDPDKYLNIISK